VKIRQQPFEACAAARRSVTPDGAVLGVEVPAPRSIADAVQAWSGNEITNQANADLRILSMADAC
jgi:hypothetical protein